MFKLKNINLINKQVILEFYQEHAMVLKLKFYLFKQFDHSLPSSQEYNELFRYYTLYLVSKHFKNTCP
jgi:hypothetical protein